MICAAVEVMPDDWSSKERQHQPNGLPSSGQQDSSKEVLCPCLVDPSDLQCAKKKHGEENLDSSPTDTLTSIN